MSDLDAPDEELRFHLDRQIEDLVAQGLDPETARAEALKRFGDPDRVLTTLESMGRRRMRRTRWSRWWSDLAADASLALRLMRRQPLFASATVLVIALGVGVSTAVFAVLDASWLRPLPFPEADRLVVLEDGQDGPGYPASLPEYEDWVREGRFLTASAAIVTNDRTLQLGDVPEQVSAAFVRGDLVATSGLAPILGRGFAPEERGGVMMLDEAFWRQRFAADPTVIGRTLDLDGVPLEVIGVMPAAARLLFGSPEIQLWWPLPDVEMLDRGLHLLSVVGRLEPGLTLAQGQERTTAMSAAIQSTGVTRHGVSMLSLRDRTFGDTRRMLVVLTAAVGLVLVVVCTNLAHLAMTRSWARTREFAVRGALGAAGGRVTRQLLTETAVLGAVGAVGGILLARVLTGWLARATGNDVLVELARQTPSVVAFAIASSIGVGMLFGVFPALRASRLARSGDLQTGRSGATVARTRVRRLLVTSEVALAVVLMVGAGLLVRTIGRLKGEDAGFAPAGVLTARIGLPTSVYTTPEAIIAYWAALLEQVRALPGVQAAGVGSHLPLLGDTNGGFQIVGRDFPEDSMPKSKKRFVGPGFFEAMGMRIESGRGILESDRRGEPEVAVISASLARRYWPGEDPIGKRIRFLWHTEAEQEIVGVIADVRSDALQLREEGTIYLAANQIGIENMALAVKTSGSPTALVEPIRRIVRDLDPRLPVHDVQTLDSVVRASLADRTAAMQLLGVFGGLAVFLAAIGVYAVAAQAVLARRREIGLRLAIGASQRAVLRSVLIEEATPVLLGIALGLAASMPASRVLTALVYGIDLVDPITLVGVTALACAASGIALLGPTLRAVRIDPATALRVE